MTPRLALLLMLGAKPGVFFWGGRVVALSLQRSSSIKSSKSSGQAAAFAVTPLVITLSLSLSLSLSL
jgi:hypothetical protein